MTSEQDIIGKLKTGFERPNGHKCYQNENGEWFYVVMKHAPFSNFGKIFFNGANIEGESINREALLMAVSKNATMLFVYPREIYAIQAKEFYDWSYDHNTNRQQWGGEYTFSVPLHIMTKHKRSFR